MKAFWLQIVLVLVGGLSRSAATGDPPPATSVRDADAVCAKCHQQIYNSYLGTPMANASGLAAERLFPGSYLHTPSGVEFRISLDDGGGGLLSYRKLGNPVVAGSEKLDYFLGSGHLGLTYLFQKDGYLLESPVAYYPDLKGYAMKPGLEELHRFPEALRVDPGCLRCHMSDVQRAEPGSENRYAGLPFLHSGVTCESCHGDTRQHVATGASAKVINPAKLDPERRDSTCIICHLEGATSVERKGRSALDWKPGENITDYLAYFDYVGVNTTRRGVSEIEQFLSSKCKRTTGAAMSCMNCHDPHRSPPPEERAAFYRAKCLVCHTQEKYVSAHYAANPDCTGCHMPKTGARNIAHVAWTDHRIRQHPKDEDRVTADALDRAELVPILPGAISARDFALGYYDLTVKGNLDEKPRAAQMLAAAAKAAPDDVAVLNAAGISADWSGDSAHAQDVYRAVLKKDPDSLTAKTNLGTLLAKAGNSQGAVELWREAFPNNQDVLELGKNLATIECLLGNKAKSVDVLKQVLTYNPDSPELRSQLRALESGGQQCPMRPTTLMLQDP